MSNSQAGSGALEILLTNILSAIKPLKEDVAARDHVINQFTAIVNSVDSLKGATVEPFGSFISNLYTRWGDLDLSIEVQGGSFVSSAVKKRKVKLLGDLLKALQKRGFAHRLEFVRSARVPVLKFESNHRNISCDISICNLLGQIKSKFLLWIAEIDERFRDMVLLVKEWAKAQLINDPKTGTLNSYSLALMVIFHFQTCEPAILPPLHEIYMGNIANDLTGEGEITEKFIQESCAANITKFRTSNANLNESSLTEIFTSFFQKFSRLNTMAAEHVICPYTGKWELKGSNAKWMTKTYPLLIEDPFEQQENTARAVNEGCLRKIVEAFASTYSILSGNQDQNTLIAALVQSRIRSKICKRTRANSSLDGGSVRPQISSMVNPSQHQPQNKQGEIHPSNFFHERPQLSTPVHQSKNQFQAMHRPRGPVSERPHFYNPVHSTENQFQNMHFLSRSSSQRPRFSNMGDASQNHFQSMQSETHPSPGVFSQRPFYSMAHSPQNHHMFESGSMTHPPHNHHMMQSGSTGHPPQNHHITQSGSAVHPPHNHHIMQSGSLVHPPHNHHIMRSVSTPHPPQSHHIMKSGSMRHPPQNNHIMQSGSTPHAPQNHHIMQSGITAHPPENRHIMQSVSMAQPPQNHHNMQSGSHPNSNVFMQRSRPIQLARGGSQQMWRPRHSM